jgi:putative DNA primase/helicase
MSDLGDSIQLAPSPVNSYSAHTPEGLLAAALDYARRGIPVFPLQPRKKKPLPRSHGFKDASQDETTIRRWWGAEPESNIGIPTGEASGWLVLDVDGPEGQESLGRLQEKYGPLPETLTQRTGGGGYQYVFRYPDGEKISNSASKIAPKIDVRGEGGYVAAPPSIHPSGRAYEWLNDDEPAEAQIWLIELARAEIQKSEGGPKEKRDLGLVLNGVPKGQRDDLINRYVWSRLTKGNTADEVKTLVAEAAQNCDPPFSIQEALKKVDRAVTKFHARENEDVNKTDMGNAHRLARQYGDQIRHCAQFGWMVYDGTRWVPDELSTVQAFAKKTVKRIYEDACRIVDDDARKELIRHAMKSESASRIQAMILLLPSEPGISVQHTLFDRDTMLLNMLNGTVDLRTGDLLPHAADNYITKIAPVEYKPDAKCPRWKRFVSEIMNGDEDLVSYLHRLSGYCLTGATEEQAWFFFFGKGSNGKSTFLDTLMHVFGEYGAVTPPETFLEQPGGTIRNDLARLRGIRFVAANEPSSNRKFDAEVIKAFTGEEQISCRFLHRELFQYSPEGKLIFAANHRPAVRDITDAFWRRIHLVPFTRQFTGKDKDSKLRRALRNEAPGILRWAIDGCLEWQRTGLNPPALVVNAVQDYREDTDLLAEFLDTYCDLADGLSITVTDLSDLYTSYCEEKKIRKPMSKQRFNEDLRGRPGIFQNRVGPERTRVWEGIGLKNTDVGSNVHYGSFGKGPRSCERCDIPPLACPVPHTDRDAQTCNHFRSM